ncbi:glycosyltransferase family 2 protein [Cellulomonas sp. H30R-01]|uniref:glycosyltransferase family 2 protein n=1 Tax=Cellulomonas TaxID=1707 RepID=UPI00138DAFD4|nr:MULTISPECIES: glycosyltransferase family 2 protein [Cellulomonas]QHT56880.1 glycosyltransferase family 2 protein [Cellulomonas sp. H30R-01]
MADVDVVVVTHDSAGHLPSLAASLRRCGALVASVTVVDNLSSDGSADVARSLALPGRVAVVDAGVNLGFGRAVNLAARHPEDRAAYLLVLNPDAAVPPDGLHRLVSTLEGRPDLACVGADLRRPDGSPVSSARSFPGLWDVARGRAHDVDHAGGLVDADWLCGALMLWRRSAFEALGGFDERYFLYYEDVDLCRRARAAGWGVAIDGGVVAEHDQGHGRPTAAVLRQANRRSRRRYARRWMGVPGAGAALLADVRERLAGVVRGDAR